MTDYRIIGVSLTETDIILSLANGKTLVTPIRRYIRVEKATPKERLGWVLTDDCHGVNWPALWEPAADGMVSVWDIEQDALYQGALDRLKAADWNIDAVSGADRELVALWRAEADINNGGFLQFLGNWGIRNYEVAAAALERIGAMATADLLRRMFAIVGRFFLADEVDSIFDIYKGLNESESQHLDELDEAFWDYPDPLPRLVVEHYGALGQTK